MNPITFQVHAAAESTYLGEKKYDVDYSKPIMARIRFGEFVTREDAEAFAAQFPKSARLAVTSLSRFEAPTTWLVVNHITLIATNGNGGTNEAGIKRYRSVVRKAESLGLVPDFSSEGTVNAYADREVFEAAL